jgi:hypothetical protein
MPISEGPLNYEEITSSSVTLSWKPPLDNGGSEITGYVIEKRDLTHGGGWVPAVAYVNAKYTHSVVPKLIEGTKYEFRVMAENLQGRSDGLPTSKPIIAKNQYIEPGQPSKPEIVDSDKDFIRIKWNPPISNGGSSIIGYNVERRDVATGRWITISKNPVPNINYTDDRVTEGRQYQYRVSAVNAAGAGKASDPSNVLSAKPMKEKPKLYLDDLGNRKIKVKAGEPVNIKVPLSGAPIPEVQWLKNGNKVPETSRISTDSNGDRTILRIDNTNRNDSDTYTVKVSNEFGEESANIEVIVVDRPSPPEAVCYPETTLSDITVAWSPPRDNGNSDITGYIVEINEPPSENWRPLPGYCPRTTFVAKNLTEGKKYKFRIKAENAYGVSDPAEGKVVEPKSPFDPPEAPEKPTIVSYGPTTCTIQWKPVTSTTSKPITGYVIEKRERGVGDWLRVNNYPTPNTSYTIQDLIEGNRYEFRVKAGMYYYIFLRAEGT